MKKYVDMISPLTRGKVKEASTFEGKSYKGEKFIIPVYYNVCEESGEQVTATE